MDLERFRGYLSILARLNFNRKLRPKLDPSDIVQQTFLEAHRAQGQFHGQTIGEQAAWLRQILACNLGKAARDLGRAKRDIDRERSLENSSMRLEALLEANQSTPSQHLSREERLLILAEAIESLPRDQQEVLLLRFCEEWTLEAIGGHLGLSRNTIARMLRRGLAILREKLVSLE